MPKTTHLGIVVTSGFGPTAFARICALAQPERTLRLLRTWCPFPVRFEMLVRAEKNESATFAYNLLRNRLRSTPGAHPTQTWSAWFIYNEVFADAVTQWCQEACEAGVIAPDEELAAQWIQTTPQEIVENATPRVIKRAKVEIANQ